MPISLGGREYREMLPLFTFFITLFSIGITQATVCQNDCDCNFSWTKDKIPESDATVRYEVMSGLVGAFTPLLAAGVGFLGYKMCSKTPNTPSSSSWRSPSSPAVNQSPNPKRNPSPFSLYGENDEEVFTYPNVNTDSPMPGRSVPPHDQRMDSSNSHYTNIHKNVKGDMVNQWFKNVNKKY